MFTVQLQVLIERADDCGSRRYFVVGEIARSEGEVVRIAALLRGTESAWQALSYGLNAVPVFAEVGSVYLNFSLWFLALAPAWLVIRKIGVSLGDRKVDRDEQNDKIEEGSIDAAIVEKEVLPGRGNLDSRERSLAGF
jgi:hypothetical protein